MKLLIEVDLEQLEAASKVRQGIWEVLPDALYGTGIQASEAGALEGEVFATGDTTRMGHMTVGSWRIE